MLTALCKAGGAECNFLARPGNLLLISQTHTATKTIILVSYYNSRDLKRCLPALFDTIDSSVEVLLVDNTSNDVDLDWASQTYPRLQLIRSPKNGGFGYANNLAARASRGDHLIFLNPDTTPQSDWLLRLSNVLDSQPTVGLVTPKILLLSEPGRINTCGNTIHLTGLSMCRGVRAPQTAFSEPDPVSAVSGACFAIRRSLFFELNGFDEEFFLYMEDTDLSLRTRLLGYEIVYTPEAIIQHDYALTFSPNKIFLQERNRYLMLLKALKWPTLLLLIPALLVAELITWGFVLLRERKGILQKLAAYGWIVEHWPEVSRQRADTQRQRRAADRDLIHALVSHLDIRQLGDTLLARMMEPILDAFFAPYGWCLRRFVNW